MVQSKITSNPMDYGDAAIRESDPYQEWHCNEDEVDNEEE